jgi:viologen exporter family transport system permease protein
MTIMKSANRYLWIGYTAARSNLAYGGEVIYRCSFLTIILYIFLRLWTVVYAATGSDRVGGLTLPQMVWYLVVTEAIYLSAPRVASEVDEDVRTGRLAVHLIRPLSYAGGHLSRAMGDRVVRFAINLTVGSVLALILVGPITITASGIGMFFATLPAAFLLDFLGMFLIGLCAFWLETTSGLALLYTRTVMMFGGMFLPLTVYPAVLQPILKVLPFASMLSAPGVMFVNPSLLLLKQAMVIQGAAVAVFLGIVGIVQFVAMRRLFSNGG